MAAMRDCSAGNTYNPGFVVVKPTTQSIKFYKTMRNVSKKYKNLKEQERFNLVLRQLTKYKLHVKATHLNSNRFMHGARYFQRVTRLLPQNGGMCSSYQKNNCSVYVVHNNWIVSKEAKIYRFREHLLWLYDEDQYYSSQTRRYIAYTNPKPETSYVSEKSQQIKRQMSALRTALAVGYLLNRTVILPTFYCGFPALHCSLNSFIHIKTFDAFFSKRYRESSFWQHPHVPNNVKRSMRYQKLVSHSASQFSKNEIGNINSDDVVRAFGGFKESLVNIGILEKVNVIFSNYSIGEIFNKTLHKAFKRSNHRQLRRGAFL